MTLFWALKLTKLSKLRANQSSVGLSESFVSLEGVLYNWLEVYRVKLKFSQNWKSGDFSIANSDEQKKMSKMISNET
jgi:hypothetical protein